MYRLLIALLILTLSFTEAMGQSFTLEQPKERWPGWYSDKSLGIVCTAGQCTVAWKDTGVYGRINIAAFDTLSAEHKSVTPFRPSYAVTAAAPVLQVVNGYTYLFWIGRDSAVHYTFSGPGTSFEEGKHYALPCNKPAAFALGMAIVYADSTLLIVAHQGRKGRLIAASCRPGSDGILDTAKVTRIPNARSATYPSATTLADGKTVRIGWTDRNIRQVLFADHAVSGRALTLPQRLEGVRTDNTPVFTGALFAGQVACLWNNKGRQMQWSYAQWKGEEEVEHVLLPGYLAPAAPVSVAMLDTSRFLLAYTGADHRLYLSRGRRYDPARWMEQFLFPDKSGYRLKDIVIPGSHDAGMSVLNGVGGQGGSAINECNTLTQVLGIEAQLKAGIRMFDLRVDQYNGELYTKHAPSDCMEDAIAGGYGEQLENVLKGISGFLEANPKEFVLLSFCHFCTRDQPLEKQAKYITETLGAERILMTDAGTIGELTLADLAGKAVITFEEHAFPASGINANTMTEKGSEAFLNYRRRYAATNQPEKMIGAQYAFFNELKGRLNGNDLVRLDWQLTEASQESIFICNDFESEQSNLLLDGVILVANTVKGNKSIIDLAETGNASLPGTLADWIGKGIIDRENKPNILYVDVAGSWITDFCIELNRSALYTR